MFLYLGSDGSSTAVSIYSYDQPSPTQLEITFHNSTKKVFEKQNLSPGETLVIGDGATTFVKWVSTPMNAEDWYRIFEQQHEGKKAQFYPKKGVSQPSHTFEEWYNEATGRSFTTDFKEEYL